MHVSVLRLHLGGGGGVCFCFRWSSVAFQNHPRNPRSQGLGWEGKKGMWCGSFKMLRALYKCGFTCFCLKLSVPDNADEENKENLNLGGWVLHHNIVSLNHMM